MFLLSAGLLSPALAQNVWTGNTSAALNVSGNYQAGASVASDGNPSATFVFGRVSSSRRALTLSSEFKVNRMQFENNGGGGFSVTGSFLNFVGGTNGIFQSSSFATTISSGIKVSDGPLTLGGDGTGLVTLSGSANNDYGGKGVTKSGTSAFLITQSISSPGTVTISGGTLAFSGTGNLASAYQLRGGVIATSGTFSRTVGTTATSINFAAGSNGGFAAYGGALTVSTNLGTWGTTGSSLTATSNLILGSSIADNVVTLSAALNLGAAARTIRLVDNANSANDAAAISGVISGAGGGLNLTGSGLLTLSNANTYTGTTTVGSGVNLSISNATGLGTTAAGTTVSSGGSLRLLGGITVGAEALSLSGTGISGENAGALRNISGNNSFGGAITLAAASRVNSDAGTLTLGGAVGGAGQNLTVGGAGNITINGVIGTTTGTLTKDGAGTLTLGAANTFTGLTTVSGGALALSGSGSLSGAVNLDASGASLNISAITASGTSLRALSGVSGSTVVLGSKALTVGSANTSTTFAGVISGSGGLIKNGTGTLTLSSSANTYTGDTIVEAGALIINGNSSATSGSLTVQATGTLGGSGTVGGATTISGIHSPGNSPGIQTFTNGLSYDGGTFVWELYSNTAAVGNRGNATLGWDGVDVSGGNLNFISPTTMSLVFNGTDSPGSSVDWTNSLWGSNQKWLLYQVTGGNIQNFDNLSIAQQNWTDSSGRGFYDSGGDASKFFLGVEGSNIYLNFNAIPEPSRAVLLLISALGFLLQRRRLA